MKTAILAAVAALTVAIGTVNAQSSSSYRTPAHNFYQNNWMAGND